MLLNHVEHREGGLYNLDAPGGSGKTLLSDVILSKVRMLREIAIATDMSGIAATLLRLGTTFHRRYGAPVPCDGQSCSYLKLNSNEARIIKECLLIMIDEVSMMDYKLLDMLDRFLHEIMKDDRPFGGKLIVLIHDFRQILPVVKGGRRAAVVGAVVMASNLWKHFQPLQLTRNMRVENMLRNCDCPAKRQHLLSHKEWLLSVGHGTVPPVIPNTNIIQIPEHMSVDSPEKLRDRVFPDFVSNHISCDYLSKCAIMSTNNEIVRQCNFELMSKIPGEPMISLSRDACVDPDDQTKVDADTLNKMELPGMPPHRLVLKKGACIILIRNLNMQERHCDGTRYIILDLTPNVIRASRLDGGANAEIFIPRIPIVSNESDFVCQLKRIQFPVLLAYYLTLNQAQGQTLMHAGMHLERSVFSHGHFYVGTSRCGDPDEVTIYADQTGFENQKHLIPTNM